jgi:hypothetical protein
MAMVLWQLGAEPFTFGALAWGHELGDRNLAVPGEPRDRELAFRAILPVAKAFNTWFESSDEPQVVVTNPGSASLLARLGRRLAYLRTDGDFPADPALIQFGRHLRFLGDRSRFPGQSLVIVLTELLRAHWVTELADFETQSLAALDAAIAPANGCTAHEAARAAELLPIGPVPTGDEDDRLEPLLDAFNEARGRRSAESVVASLRRPIEAHYRELVFDLAWPLLWRCFEREAALEPAAHVQRRWNEDMNVLAWHRENIGPRRLRQSHKQAARTLQTWEGANQLLTAEEAIDDPMRMIPHLLAHEAMVGTVLEVNLENRVLSAKGRRVKRPLVRLQLSARCIMPLRKNLYWTGDPQGHPYELIELEPTGEHEWVAVLRYPSGSKRDRPEVGGEATFSKYGFGGGYRAQYPTDPPWTHVRERIEQASLEDEHDAGGWQ